MKVKAKALRDFPIANDDNTERRTVREGEEIEVNLTKARALAEQGKVSFTEPERPKQSRAAASEE